MLVREMFDEEHVPLLYVDMDTYLPKLKLDPQARSKALYGAHYITGRLIDLPLKASTARPNPKRPDRFPKHRARRAQ